MQHIKPNYVVIGGGTGSFALLSGLRDTPVNLTALVGMADDGGSTGSLRDELGVLPPGDVRQCLVALSTAPAELRDLFSYRFKDSALAGHSLGNLFLSAAEKTTNSFSEAVRLCSDVLRVRGRVVPITLDDIRLALELGDHTILRGQRTIDDSTFCNDTPHPRLFLEPAGRINPEADQALREADIIVLAPGDLYTSLGPLLIVEGVAEALVASKARIIYMCNLVVKAGHTVGMTVADHAAELERFVGRECIDCVIYNTAQPPAALLQRYAQVGEQMVAADQAQLAQAHYRSVGTALVSESVPQIVQGDILSRTGRRSYIRHDSQLAAAAVFAAAK